MKYLEYYFKDPNLDDDEFVKTKIIDSIISKGSPNSSCWWSSMKPSTDNFKNYFDYIKHLHNKFFRNNMSENLPTIDTRSTAKQCPAINNLLANSYLIKSPSDIIITISKDGGFIFNSPNKLIEITSHQNNQFHTKENNIFGEKMNLKFEFPVYIKSSIPYIYLPPQYHGKLWYDNAIGVISGNYAAGQPLNINVFVEIPKDKPVTYEIKEGDVLAYIWFPERTKLKHTSQRFYNRLFRTKWSPKSGFN